MATDVSRPGDLGAQIRSHDAPEISVILNNMGVLQRTLRRGGHPYVIEMLTLHIEEMIARRKFALVHASYLRMLQGGWNGHQGQIGVISNAERTSRAEWQTWRDQLRNRGRALRWNFILGKHYPIHPGFKPNGRADAVMQARSLLAVGISGDIPVPGTGAPQ